MGKRSVLNPAFRRKQRVKLERPLFEWGGVFENWARSFVRRNFWRVASLFLSEEDAVQECAVVFIKCRNKYAGKIDEAKHMMALYQTALTRAWHSFATRDPHFRYEPAGRYTVPNAVTYSEGPLLALLSQVDSELKTAIVALINAPDEFLSIIFKGDDTKLITRRLSRMFRIQAGERDLITELRELLEGFTA